MNELIEAVFEGLAICQPDNPGTRWWLVLLYIAIVFGAFGVGASNSAFS